MTLINHADRVEIACLAQLVNAIAPITTKNDGGILRQAIWYPLHELTERGHGEVLSHRLECSKSLVKGREIPSVYSAVVYDSDNREMTLFVLNSNLEKSEPLEIEVNGSKFAIKSVRRLVGKNLTSVNTFDNPEEISMEELKDFDSSVLELPPASFSVVTVEVAK